MRQFIVTLQDGIEPEDVAPIVALIAALKGVGTIEAVDDLEQGSFDLSSHSIFGPGGPLKPGERRPLSGRDLGPDDPMLPHHPTVLER